MVALKLEGEAIALTALSLGPPLVHELGGLEDHFLIFKELR
jgi:hypothetical protein